jgi:hypothetical protein
MVADPYPSSDPSADTGHLVVFLAFARSDGLEFTQKLHRLLGSLSAPKITPWMDTDRKPVGGTGDAIQNAIAGARVVLYVMTRASVARGHYSHDELTRARLLAIPVIVLKIQPDGPGFIPPVHIQEDLLIPFAGARAEPSGGCFRRTCWQRRAKTRPRVSSRKGVPAQAGPQVSTPGETRPYTVGWVLTPGGQFSGGVDTRVAVAPGSVLASVHFGLPAWAIKRRDVMKWTRWQFGSAERHRRVACDRQGRDQATARFASARVPDALNAAT